MRVHKIIILSISIFLGCTEANEELSSNWEYFLPNEKGANSYALLALDQEIKEGNYGDIHSIMMAKNHSVIFENFYDGHKRSETIHLGRGTRAVFTMALDSIIKQIGLNHEDKIIDLLPDHVGYFENIPQKDKITLGHLIYHRSGFWWDDIDLLDPSDDHDNVKMKGSDDWAAYVLSTRMIREPGMEYNFNSGHFILLSLILESNLEGRLEEKIEEILFKPLGISQWTWENTPEGILNTESGLSLTIEDMTKIGLVFMDNGYWNGEKVLSEDWIKTMKINQYRDGYYGRTLSWLQFDLYHPALEGKFGVENYFTWGVGGNFIILFPEYDYVMVLNGNFENNFEEFIITDILRKFILPSLSVKQSET